MNGEFPTLYVCLCWHDRPHCVTESSYLALCQRESHDHPWNWQSHADFSLHSLCRTSSNSRVLTPNGNTPENMSKPIYYYKSWAWSNSYLSLGLTNWQAAPHNFLINHSMLRKFHFLFHQMLSHCHSWHTKQFHHLLPFLLGMVILRNKLIKSLNQIDRCDFSSNFLIEMCI